MNMSCQTMAGMWGNFTTGPLLSVSRARNMRSHSSYLLPSSEHSGRDLSDNPAAPINHPNTSDPRYTPIGELASAGCTRRLCICSQTCGDGCPPHRLSIFPAITKQHRVLPSRVARRFPLPSKRTTQLGQSPRSIPLDKEDARVDVPLICKRPH